LSPINSDRKEHHRQESNVSISSLEYAETKKGKFNLTFSAVIFMNNLVYPDSRSLHSFHGAINELDSFDHKKNQNDTQSLNVSNISENIDENLDEIESDHFSDTIDDPDISGEKDEPELNETEPEVNEKVPELNEIKPEVQECSPEFFNAMQHSFVGLSEWVKRPNIYRI
jgi:hypothetical protein